MREAPLRMEKEPRAKRTRRQRGRALSRATPPLSRL